MTAPLPQWLDPASAPTPEKTRQTVRETVHALFDLYWDRMMEMVAGGYFIDRAYDELFKEHPITASIHRGMFTRWMNSSPERKRQHDEACEFRSEHLRGLAVRYAIADPSDDPRLSLMDVQSRKLAVDTLRWSAGVDNRARFGDVKTINTTATISVLAALTDARARVVAMRPTIDVLPPVDMLTAPQLLDQIDSTDVDDDDL